MKIGILASFFHSRTDINLLIEYYGQSHQIVLFCTEKDEPICNQLFRNKAEIRIIRERQHNIWNYLWERLFLLCKKKPASLQNYYLMEHFKASNLPTEAARNKASRIIKLQKVLPGFVSYDKYLDNIKPVCQTEISDIDRFLVFTEIIDDYLLARLKKENKRVTFYVYSWDHPCKQTRFPAFARYCVWMEGLKDDLSKLQGISAKQISVIGSTQFSYIFKYKEIQRSNPVIKHYIVFACAIGISGLIQEEVDIIKSISAALTSVQPDWILIVRPYPHVKNWHVYDELAGMANIQFDNNFKSAEHVVAPESYVEKYNLISNAKAFLHLGSTLGLEACYFDVPVFTIDLIPANQKELSVFNFVHQYQNDKYFNHKYPDNVITSIEQFKQIFSNNFSNGLLRPNREIPAELPLKSILTIGEALFS